MVTYPSHPNRGWFSVFLLMSNPIIRMNNLEARYAEVLPGKFYLKPDVEDLEIYLREQFFLDPSETVLKAEKPGEGNMNYVLRITTNIRTFIIKQARPWVEKYPHIPAPIERNAVEARYFKLTQKAPKLAAFSPKLLFEDVANNILILNDLGQASDYTFLYRGGQLTETEIQTLLRYLKTLHRIHEPSYPRNECMRALNHEHLFRFPFDPKNEFDLNGIQPGLQDLAVPIQHNKNLIKEITRLGEIYLADGNVLIHGDFYPGSWLKATQGLMVIDPEFSFNGFAEFDLGVLLAHLIMAHQPAQYGELILNECRAQRDLDEKLIAGFAGTEILRRLLGVAQLPLDRTLQEKENLIQHAVSYLLEGKMKTV